VLPHALVVVLVAWALAGRRRLHGEVAA
jgi:hypothetical protein